MGQRDIIKEAIADAKRIRQVAENSAKQKLIEEMAPNIRSIVERQINDSLCEDQDRMRRHADGYGETEFEEGLDTLAKGDVDMKNKKDMELDNESLGAMFPGISEEEDDLEGMDSVDEMADEEMEEMSIPTLGEEEEEDLEGEMEEEVYIDEEALAQAYENVMKYDAALSEASVDWKPEVSKGFKDTYSPTVWETEKNPPSRGSHALNDEESGEKAWDEARPPKAQDYSVKESIVRNLREHPETGAYVAHLEEQLGTAIEMIKRLKSEVKGVNLFNTKMLHVNEMLHKYGKKLTTEQKKTMIQKIDEAKSPREVKMVAGSLSAFFNSGSKLSESKRRNKPNASRPRTSGQPKQSVLRESVENRADNDKYARIRQLAGLVD